MMIGSPRGAGQPQPPGRAVECRDAGMVLLEAALVIPMLVAVTLAGLGVARLAVDELAVAAAARDGALAAARGQGEAAVASLVRERVPQAAVVVRHRGDRTFVEVSAATHLPRLAGGFSVQHRAGATALREPTW